MWTQPKGNKCCATCQYWCGPRTAHHSGAAVVDSPGTRGKCAAGTPGDAIPGPTAMRSSCAKYQVWANLK